MKPSVWTLLCPLLLAATVALARPDAQEPASNSLFDPARHMRVSEVRPGMKGYGLSVFRGTKIDRFDVEVLAVLHNFNPKSDVVLIKCKGANLELTGAVAGMSGSPVYLRDEAGRERMIGAFAYGWPMTKEPVAGVQPIEYMLAMPATKRPATPSDANPATPGTGPAAAGTRDAELSVDQPAARLSWSFAEATGWPNGSKLLEPKAQPLASHDGLREREPSGRLSVDSVNVTRLQPLATPLMVGGISQKTLDAFAPLFSAYGLVPLQAGGSSSAPPGEAPAPLEPGSVMAVPLLTGDADMTAIGTCTDVVGDRVFGFGHPFQNEGSVVLPMGSGRVNSIIPNLMTSFKLGSLTATRGRIVADRSVGVAGELGEPPPTVPIEVRVLYTDGSLDRTYSFRSALHPKFTPLLAGAAIMQSVAGTNDLPQLNTVEYDLTVEFANGRSLRLNNKSVNVNPMTLFTELGTPMVTAAENPFERVPLKKVSGTVRVTPAARDAQILEVNVPKNKYRPGDAVRAFVTYKPFRSPEAIMPVELELPKDLSEGTYQVVFSDWQRYATDELQGKPFRFTAERAGEVFDVLKDVASIRHDALYVRLVRQPDGVAVGRTAMPRLPSSRRQILIGAGRSTTSKFVSSTVKSFPTNHVFTGAADFAITIDRDVKVEPRKPSPLVAPPTTTR